jgi:hypothetical protein
MERGADESAGWSAFAVDFLIDLMNDLLSRTLSSYQVIYAAVSTAPSSLRSATPTLKGELFKLSAFNSLSKLASFFRSTSESAFYVFV